MPSTETATAAAKMPRSAPWRFRTTRSPADAGDQGGDDCGADEEPERDAASVVFHTPTNSRPLKTVGVAEPVEAPRDRRMQRQQADQRRALGRHEPPVGERRERAVHRAGADAPRGVGVGVELRPANHGSGGQEQSERGHDGGRELDDDTAGREEQRHEREAGGEEPGEDVPAAVVARLVGDDGGGRPASSVSRSASVTKT